jgi:hypothetical protein
MTQLTPGRDPLPRAISPMAEAEIQGLLGQSVRYRGFVLIPQNNLTWLIRPERSPMRVLPFRAPASSLSDVQALIDWRLAQAA